MFQVNSLRVNPPAGSIIAFPSNDIIDGWALCDGSVYNSAANPNLHIALGSPNPAVLPNLNAAYLRGTGTNGVYTGPSLRTTANDQTKGHTHTHTDPGHSHRYFYQSSTSSGGNNYPNRRNNTTSTLTTSGAKSNISLANAGDAETRPYTYVVNWLIKLG